MVQGGAGQGGQGGQGVQGGQSVQGGQGGQVDPDVRENTWFWWIWAKIPSGTRGLGDSEGPSGADNF